MDTSDLMGQLQGMMNDPQTMEKVRAVLGDQTPGSLPSDGEELAQMTQKVKQIYDRVNGAPDQRAALLRALQPYLNNTRASKVDAAVRLLNLSKLSGVLRELK